MKALSPKVKRPERDDYSPQLGSKVKMREILLPLQHIYSRLAAQEPSLHIVTMDTHGIKPQMQ
jgi:hypothetical protein